MDDNCLKNVSSQCWFCSYNEAAKSLGLDSPIRLGHLDVEGKHEYFWYNNDSCAPVFRNTDLRIIVFMRFLPLTQILPGSFFPRGSKIYYYDDENLTIYQIANFLNIETVRIFANLSNLRAKQAYPATIKAKNGNDIPIWMLEPLIEEGEEWKASQQPVKYINIFEEDEEYDLSAITPQQIKILGKGDYVIHGEDLYQVELNPLYGLGLTKQEIDIDSLLKS